MAKETEPVYIQAEKKNGKSIKIDLNVTLSTLEEIKNRIGLDKWFTPKQLKNEMNKYSTSSPEKASIVMRLRRLSIKQFLKTKRGICKGRTNNILAYNLTEDIYYNILPKFKKRLIESTKEKIEKYKDKIII